MAELRDEDAADRLRVYPVLTRWLIGGVVLELLLFLVPLAPFAVPLLALLTPLHRSRWRLAVLWVLAVIIAYVVVAPFIIDWTGFFIPDDGSGGP
ncbi:hypothetical protein [Homoserinibacter sp. YIM 151385]|uniref:hypothetical protein n=1 Tax=Homoserinibacter sp. YIM 151385 TaxID=2985506 RepID=UPI0022F11CD9|nr:hypothetical protein [Homoserinibacter sp. YIM 151385]WBU39242.1 hypothetical protein OF852_06605 [Homoserinibacter sp. YIM 151385]